MSGKTDQAKGRIKQAAGDLTDNDDLKREGKADETAGKVKKVIGDAKETLEDVVDSVKKQAELIRRHPRRGVARTSVPGEMPADPRSVGISASVRRCRQP